MQARSVYGFLPRSIESSKLLSSRLTGHVMGWYDFLRIWVHHHFKIKGRVGARPRPAYCNVQKTYLKNEPEYL
jgi:hypothetical protein